MTEQGTETVQDKLQKLRKDIHLFYSNDFSDRDKLTQQEREYVKELSKEMYDKILLHVLFADITDISKSIRKMETTLKKLSRRPWKFGKNK